MSDPYADFSLTVAGADLSVVWLAKGGATLSIGGDQPMDQPPCSITLTNAQLTAIAVHIGNNAVAKVADKIGHHAADTVATALAKRELRRALIASLLADTRDDEPWRTPGYHGEKP